MYNRFTDTITMILRLVDSYVFIFFSWYGLLCWSNFAKEEAYGSTAYVSFDLQRQVLQAGQAVTASHILQTTRKKIITFVAWVRLICCVMWVFCHWASFPFLEIFKSWRTNAGISWRAAMRHGIWEQRSGSQSQHRFDIVLEMSRHITSHRLPCINFR